MSTSARPGARGGWVGRSVDSGRRWLREKDGARCYPGTWAQAATAERRGGCSAGSRGQRAGVGDRGSHAACQVQVAMGQGTRARSPAAPGQSPSSPQVQSARPGCSRTRLSAGPRSASESPGVPGARISAPERGALTMEHGLRERAWSWWPQLQQEHALTAHSHSQDPGLPRSYRESVPGRAVSVAGSSYPRRACCFIHPKGGGTHQGPALRFAFPITSVGSAGSVLSVSTLRLVCRFDLQVNHWGAFTAPPRLPSPGHLRPPRALPVRLDQDQRSARISKAPQEEWVGLLIPGDLRQKTSPMTSSRLGKIRRLGSKSIGC